MIRSRLSYVRYYLRILTLLLPACAYFIAIKIRFGFNFFFPGRARWSALLLGNYPSDHHRVGNGRRRVRPLERRAAILSGQKSRRLLEALAFTYAVVMALGFLYRQASYSRFVIGISAIALFVLATLARIAFRVFLECCAIAARTKSRF